jgi:hypothetical protein
MMTTIFLLLATGGMSGFAVYLFRRHVQQQVAVAELLVHRQYSLLINGLEADGNKIKAEIAKFYDASVGQLVGSVRQ